MNINPKAKRILCFGDSLTFGHDPKTDKRFESKDRWTGILQSLLGNNFEIIEEGLGGRTTNLDDPKKEGRNGLKYFAPCVMSQVPLDFIIILIGINDLKMRFNRSPKEIAASFSGYKDAVIAACDKWRVKLPKVILVSPPIIKEDKLPKEWHMEGAGKKSEKFSFEYKAIAEQLGFEFVDIAQVAVTSDVDGTHISKEANKGIAELLFQKISSVL